jgi:hypothetical protein
MSLQKCIGSCGKEKELNNTNFYWRNNRNKWYSVCITCWNERERKRHKNNKEENNKRKKKYNEENKDKIRSYIKKYNEKHKKEINEYQKEYKIKNIDKEKLRSKIHYKNNKENINKKHKKHYEENKENINKKRKEYKKNNKEKINSYIKKYNEEHKKEIREREKRWSKARRKNEPSFRLRKIISCSVNRALKRSGSSKNGSILKHLNITEIKKHIESKFEYWMTWQNQGKYNPNTWNDNDSSTWTWQLDHIIPQSNLLYDSMEHSNFKKCWALENIRPLSSKQNLLDGVNRTRHTK